MNAGIYIRVSTEHQVLEGYSIKAQEEVLIKYAKRMNFNIYSIYADKGISGKNIKDREEVKRLISDIENLKINVVILYKFDRMTRDVKDTEEFINLIHTYEIELHTLSSGIVDVSSATGRFMTRINGAVAQLEREQTIERIKFAFEQKVREGYSLCSKVCSYGYDRPKHSKIQVVNPKEALVVKKIFDMYLNGHSCYKIANYLNIEKIPTKTNKTWQAKTVKAILINSTYIGKVRYGVNKKEGFEVFGKHEPIIDVKIWDMVQSKINKLSRVSRTNCPKDDIYFSGFLYCACCKARLTTSRVVKKYNGEKVVYNNYKCINKENGTCAAKAISHKKIEEAFKRLLNTVELNININDKTIDEEYVSDKFINKQISVLKRKRKSVMKQYLNSSVTDEEFNYLLLKIDNEIKLLEKEQMRKKNIDLKEEVPTLLSEHWNILDNFQKREFLINFVSKIYVLNNKNIIENIILDY